MTQTQSPPRSDVSPAELERLLAAGEVTLIDVREDFEHRGEHIAPSENMPLSKFDADALLARDDTDRIVLHCKSGARSGKAAAQLAAAGVSVPQLTGGIDAWKSAGKPTVKPKGAPKLDVMRQMQITAGSLTLVGTLLGVFVSPWFLIVPGFIGTGLTFAGLSGWCGMAKALALMPWNRA